MKKRLTALALVLILIVYCSIASYAADGFNKAVFDNAPDVYVSRDDMTGDLLAASESLLGDKGTITPVSGGGYVIVYSGVAISDVLNLNSLIFKYRADSWAFIDSAIIKIGNKRYKLDNLNVKRGTTNAGGKGEDVNIELTSALIPMMNDLIEHRDEEIKVRLHGESRDVDFILTDDVKNGVINIYNLYVAGGGTSKTSMKTMDMITDMTVTVGQD